MRVPDLCAGTVAVDVVSRIRSAQTGPLWTLARQLSTSVVNLTGRAQSNNGSKLGAVPKVVSAAYWVSSVFELGHHNVGRSKLLTKGLCRKGVKGKASTCTLSKVGNRGADQCRINHLRLDQCQGELVRWPEVSSLERQIRIAVEPHEWDVILTSICIH